MFKKSIIFCFLLFVSLPVGFSQTDASIDAIPEAAGYDFSETVLSIRYAPGLAAYSKYFWLSFYMNNVDVYLRLYNIVEVSIGLLSHINTKFGDSLFFFGTIRFAPRIGSYLPAIGVGLCLNSKNILYFNMNIYEGLFSVYINVIPIRFDFRLPEIYSIQWGLVFSIFEFKYGSILPSGDNPSLQTTGDFYFDVTLFSMGVQVYF